MPSATWQLLLRMGGYRHPSDFENADMLTRGFDPEKCRGDYSIARGDFVNLKPLGGSLIQARVLEFNSLAELGGGNGVGVVIGFPGSEDGGCQVEGVFVGEIIYFSTQNVFHVEQRS